MTFRIFEQFPELRYGFSERNDGAMPLSSNILPEAEELQRRIKFFESNNILANQVVHARLVHSNNVTVVRNSEIKFFPKTDGLVTGEKNICLTVTAADCFPVYFYDPVKRMIGLTHAGWRGIVSNIAVNAILKMQELGSNAKNILVGIGPGIQQHHFEIQEDVLSQFTQYEKFVKRDSGKIFVDLPGILQYQLQEMGLESSNIEQSPDCTYCLSEKYFSFRRDKPEHVQAMLAFIILL